MKLLQFIIIILIIILLFTYKNYKKQFEYLNIDGQKIITDFAFSLKELKYFLEDELNSQLLRTKKLFIPSLYTNKIILNNKNINFDENSFRIHGLEIRDNMLRINNNLVWDEALLELKENIQVTNQIRINGDQHNMIINKSGNNFDIENQVPYFVQDFTGDMNTRPAEGANWLAEWRYRETGYNNSIARVDTTRSKLSSDNTTSGYNGSRTPLGHGGRSTSKTFLMNPLIIDGTIKSNLFKDRNNTSLQLDNEDKPLIYDVRTDF